MTFDDLLGEAEKPTTPAKSEYDLAEVVTGVSVPWLVQVFRLPRPKLQEMIASVKPIRYGRNGAKYYDLPTVAAYLVKPQVEFEEFLKTVKPQQLPENLREAYWNAKLKEQKFRRLAGELWTTESVLSVFGETFKTIRVTTQLWAETVNEMTGLTDEQRKIIMDLSDNLLADLHKALVVQAKNNATGNQLTELDRDYNE